MTKFTKPVCSTCGSDDVRFDAWAAWNATTQELELANDFDHSHCEACEGECSIEDEELEDEELHEARAHAAAINNGWLPNTIEYRKAMEINLETDSE